MHDRSPFRSARRSRQAATLALWLLSACTFLRGPSVPMASTTDVVPVATGPRVLLVILPGVGDTPDDLVRHGMVEMVRARDHRRVSARLATVARDLGGDARPGAAAAPGDVTGGFGTHTGTAARPGRIDEAVPWSGCSQV
jgi:hypothetical protein